VIVRVARTEDVIVPPVRGELYIGHLGVSPERRGGGLGAALMAHVIAQHRHSGLRKVVGDVAVSNPRAQQLYERLGFAVTAERRSRLANAQGVVVNPAGGNADVMPMRAAQSNKIILQPRKQKAPRNEAGPSQ
jgi:ribosomal protein S18 acetylase RimI-like enzyme